MLANGIHMSTLVNRSTRLTLVTGMQQRSALLVLIFVCSMEADSACCGPAKAESAGNLVLYILHRFSRSDKHRRKLLAPSVS